jgi:hypothetical protein
MDQLEVFTVTKKKRRQSAKEFMAELAADPEYVRMRAEKDEKSRQRKERLDGIARPILEKLRDAGFPAESIHDLVKTFAPLPEEAVDILIASLKSCLEEPIQESLARALGAAKTPFDGRPLAALFDSTSDESLRFAILNTIALARPNSIDEWIQKISQNEYRRKQLADLGHEW